MEEDSDTLCAMHCSRAPVQPGAHFASASHFRVRGDVLRCSCSLSATYICASKEHIMSSITGDEATCPSSGVAPPEMASRPGAWFGEGRRRQCSWWAPVSHMHLVVQRFCMFQR